MTHASPTDDTALPKRRRHLTSPKRATSKPDSLTLAAAILASAAPDPATIGDRDGARKVLGDAIDHLRASLDGLGGKRATLDDYAGKEFPALTFGNSGPKMQEVYESKWPYVAMAMIVLERDAAGCRDLYAETEDAGDADAYASTITEMRDTADWLRTTADFLTDASARMMCGMCRLHKERGGTEADCSPLRDVTASHPAD